MVTIDTLWGPATAPGLGERGADLAPIIALPTWSTLQFNGGTPGITRADALLMERIELIRVTIARRSLEVYFQPIVSLRSGEAIGVEALARFAPLPVRSPDLWFTEAASLGLGVDLEVLALELALSQLTRLPAHLYLSLNASVEAILSEEFRATMADIPAERIVLELTEHTPVEDYTRLSLVIDELRSRGVRLAIDDAGAGFSSLRHILDLQPDVIKLDIGLIRGIDRDPARQSLGRALLAFALDAFDASVVAEGIETPGELAALRELGCPCGQGFLLGRPVRLRELPAVVTYAGQADPSRSMPFAP